MTINRRTCLAATLVPALVAGLPACSRPTQVTSTWNESRATGLTYGKVLVVGVAENSNQRRRFENSMVNALEGGRITAWASHTLMDSGLQPSRETLTPIVQSSGADAVLLTRLVSHEVSGEAVDAKTGVRTAPASEHGHNIFNYDFLEYSTGAHIVAKSTVTLKTEIFSAKSGNLVYSIESTTFDKESEFEIIDEATRAIGDRLRTDRVVR